MVLKNPHKYEAGKTIVYFVRHGQFEGQGTRPVGLPDPGTIFPGPKLTKKGQKQAKEVAKEIYKIKSEIDGLYCSGMKRAIETAEEIGKKIGKKPIIWPGIEEFSGFHLFRGKIHHIKFWKNYFLNRKARKSFNNLLKKNEGKVIVVVAHANVIKSLLFGKMGLSLKKLSMFHHMNCYISAAQYKKTKLDHINCFNSNTLNHSDVKPQI